MDAFNTLNGVDCSGHVEKKNGMSYLPWAWAWAELKKRYPDSYYTIYEGDGGRLYHTDGRTCWVKTGVTLVDGDKKLEHIEYLPVMDMRNRSIPANAVTSTDANKAVQRSLTKACARHGLGLYVYAGEDLPEDVQNEPAPDAETPPESTRKPAQTQQKHDQQTPPPAKPAQEWTAQKAINQWCKNHRVSVKDFGAYRKAAIAGDLVDDIPSEQLTKAQCDTLLDAIARNFLPAQEQPA